MGEVDTGTHQIIFNVLFTDHDKAGAKQQNFTELGTMVLENFKNEDGTLKRIPYELIANRVFTTVEIPSENNECFYKNLQKLVESTDESHKVVLEKFKDKVESHYKLCKEQKAYIQKNINSLNSEIRTAKVEISSAKQDITDTVEETQKVNTDIVDTKNKMYTEFVAILGIFSALMFGMISGFDIIIETLALLGSEEITMGRIVIGSSALAISLITLLYTLIQWIGHLIKNPFRHQGFDPEKQKDKPLGGFEYRHSLYLLAVYLLLNILFLGVILVIASNSGFINAVYDGTFSWSLIADEKRFASLAILINIGIIIFIDYTLIGKRLFSDRERKKKTNPIKEFF